jgi:hypothetical protein
MPDNTIIAALVTTDSGMSYSSGIFVQNYLEITFQELNLLAKGRYFGILLKL